MKKRTKPKKTKGPADGGRGGNEEGKGGESLLERGERIPKKLKALADAREEKESRRKSSRFGATSFNAGKGVMLRPFLRTT